MSPIPRNSVSGTPRLKHRSPRVKAFLTKRFFASSVFEASLRLGFECPCRTSPSRTRDCNEDSARAETGEGDVRALEGKFTGAHRLRIGDWRVRFRRVQGGAIHVLAVENHG